MNDKHLDDMLKTYFSAKEPYTYRIKVKEKKEFIMNYKKVLKYSVVGLCLVAVLSAGIFSTHLFTVESDSKPENKKDGLIINACAATVSTADEITTTPKKKVTSVKAQTGGGIDRVPFVAYFSENDDFLWSADYIKDEKTGKYQEEGINSDLKSESKEIYHKYSCDQIALEIKGDNIDSFEVVSENSSFNYSQYNRYYERYLEGDISKDEAEEYSQEIKGYSNEVNEVVSDYTNIPYDKKSLLFIYPDESSLQKAIEKKAGISKVKAWQSYKKSDLNKYYNAEDEFFKKADLNKFIGDNIKITVHYKDGTKEKVNVKLSVDKNKRYVLNYI